MSRIMNVRFSAGGLEIRSAVQLAFAPLIFLCSAATCSELLVIFPQRISTCLHQHLTRRKPSYCGLVTMTHHPLKALVSTIRIAWDSRRVAAFANKFLRMRTKRDLVLKFWLHVPKSPVSVGMQQLCLYFYRLCYSVMLKSLPHCA